MIKVEVFFDYVCPYCYRGHKNLLDLMGKYPEIDITWRPCESHPRPEPSPVHSDMAIQGMYYVEEHHGDILNYHHLVYEAHFEKGMDLSSALVLSSLASQCGVESGDFEKSLAGNCYQKQVEEGNRYTWETNRLDAVPSYRSGEHFIGSRNGILVSAKELDGFLQELAER